MDESNLNNISRNLLPLHQPHKIGGNTDIKTLNGVNTKTPNGEITNGEITSGKKVKATDSLQNLCGSHFARILRILRFSQGVSLTNNSDSLASDGEVYTEYLVVRIILMRTVCQVVLSGSHPSLTFHALAWLKMKLCAFSKTVHTSGNMS